MKKAQIIVHEVEKHFETFGDRHCGYQAKYDSEVSCDGTQNCYCLCTGCRRTIRDQEFLEKIKEMAS